MEGLADYGYTVILLSILNNNYYYNIIRTMIIINISQLIEEVKVAPIAPLELHDKII